MVTIKFDGGELRLEHKTNAEWLDAVLNTHRAFTRGALDKLRAAEGASTLVDPKKGSETQALDARVLLSEARALMESALSWNDRMRPVTKEELERP